MRDHVGEHPAAGIGTILMVEENAALAQTYRSQLAPLGYTIVMASDGRSALSLLDGEAIDCVLLDIKLPDMDGLEVLQRARKLPRPPAVVVITANASLGMAVQAVRAGAFDYLVKPFSAARFRTTVANALATTDLRREVESFRQTAERADHFSFGNPMQDGAIEPLAVAERRYIERVIEVCGGNIQRAARLLEVSPSTIYRKKESWGGIDRSR